MNAIAIGSERLWEHTSELQDDSHNRALACSTNTELTGAIGMNACEVGFDFDV
jgi:hypothetical protein